MARNIEYKCQCEDAAQLTAIMARAVALGADHTATLRQRDTYFAARQGRLKLREWETEAGERGAEIIGYSRPDAAASRLSAYIRVPITAPADLREALRATLGETVTVAKTRELYLYGATRIHCDTVADLGWFVELETILPPDVTPEDEATFHAEHDHVLAGLGLRELRPIGVSYSDLARGE